MSVLYDPRVCWVSNEEVHIDTAHGTWWARPVPNADGGDSLWELWQPDAEEPDGYHASAEEAIERVLGAAE